MNMNYDNRDKRADVTNRAFNIYLSQVKQKLANKDLSKAEYEFICDTWLKLGTNTAATIIICNRRGVLTDS